MSLDCIRIPVDNDSDIRRDVIPALIARHIAEVGPVPLGKDGKASTAAIIRWSMRDAAGSQLRDERKVAVAAATLFEQQLATAKHELATANGRVVAAETAALVLRTELNAKAQWASSSAAAVDPSESKGRHFVPVANDGARLKSARESAGLTQQELAAHLGYSDRSAVSLAERGRAPLSASMKTWLEGSAQ